MTNFFSWRTSLKPSIFVTKDLVFDFFIKTIIFVDFLFSDIRRRLQRGPLIASSNDSGPWVMLFIAKTPSSVFNILHKYSTLSWYSINTACQKCTRTMQNIRLIKMVSSTIQTYNTIQRCHMSNKKASLGCKPVYKQL